MMTPVFNQFQSWAKKTFSNVYSQILRNFVVAPLHVGPVSSKQTIPSEILLKQANFKSSIQNSIVEIEI